MKRRQYNFLLMRIMVATCLLLAGCGPAAEPAKAELPPATIRWSAWETNNQGEAQLMRQFQAAHPQIDFERSSQDFTPGMFVIETPSPDLINVDVGWWLAQLAREGKIVDLTELWVETGLTEHVSTSIQQVSAFQDRQFYIPVGVGWKAIYYNKQIFADYNLSPPETWEDFLAICATLLAHGEVPLSISGNNALAIYGWFEYLNLRMNGAPFYRDLMAGKERYDDPRVRSVMETWQSLFASGYFIERPGTVGELTSMTAIIRGGTGASDGQPAVMVLANTYGYGNLPPSFQSEIDFFRFPIMDPSIAVAEVIEPFGYMVPVGADQLPSTLAFLEYISSLPAQLITAQMPMYSSARYAPARSDVESEQLSANQRNGLALINAAHETVPAFVYSLPPQMLPLVDAQFTGFVRKPEAIDAFISKFEAARQQMVDQGLLLTE